MSKMKLPSGEQLTVSYGVIDESGGLMIRLHKRIQRNDFRWAKPPKDQP